MRLLIMTLALLSLTACANTLEGAKKDSDRFSEKMQKVATTITEP